MKIHVLTLQEGVPQHVREEFDAAKIDLESVDLRFLEKLKMTGTVVRERDVVTLEADVHSRVRHTCGKCLKEVDETLDVPLKLYYDAKEKEEIDTLDDIREAVLIDQPMTYVCETSCLGLCPNCGINLNEQKCTCREKSVSGPFADLKKMQKKTKKKE